MAAKRSAEGEGSPSKQPKVNLNKDFCDFLQELADYEKNVVRNIHKSNVYRKAAFALANHDKRITSGAEARKLEGIGEKIGAKIDEFIETGRLRKLDKIHDDPTSQAIQLLTSVMGVGPAHAAEFIKRGITTVEQLRGEKSLNHMQQVGVKYYEELKERIPRAEMDLLKDKALSLIHAVVPEARVEVCGSYRRGAASSGDLDVLMTVDSFTSKSKNSHDELLQKAVDEMVREHFVTDVLSCGASKFMGVCKLPDSDTSKHLHRRIDIRLWPSDQFVPALLYFTGSDELNKEMRRKAIEMGFHLNEFRICTVGDTGVHGDALEVKTEKDIFDYLGMEYRPPEER